MGLKHASREKKLPMVNFLIFVHKNVYRIRFQKIKIGPLKGFEKKEFFSLLLMRKRLSSGQKWFLRNEEKCIFLKTLSTPDFDLLKSNSIYIFVDENQKNYHGQFFFSWCMFSFHVSSCPLAITHSEDVVVITCLKATFHSCVSTAIQVHSSLPP